MKYLVGCEKLHIVNNLFLWYKKEETLSASFGGVIDMKIEQQNQIKEFLNEEFGADKGQELFDNDIRYV